MAYDLLLSGGTVVDPSQALRARRDVAIAGGTIALIAEEIPRDQAVRTIDVSGKLVTPGLIDLHGHFYWGVGNGVDPDGSCLTSGVTTAADGGTAGAMSFGGFKRHLVERSRTRLFAWLNISSIGLIDSRVGELGNVTYGDVRAAVRTVEQNRDLILGLKLRVSEYVVGVDPIPHLELLRRAADAARTRTMIHIGESGIGLAEILSYLRPGDVVSHCFTGGRNGILDQNGRLLEAVVAARQAGILFDAAAGRRHFSFRVAGAAIEQGFPPDTISTDLSQRSARDPRFRLPLMMAWHLAAGMPEDQTILAVTANPAAVIERVPALGTLATGAPADVAVLEVQPEESVWRDGTGAEFGVAQQVVPVLTLRQGRIGGEPS